MARKSASLAIGILLATLVAAVLIVGGISGGSRAFGAATAPPDSGSAYRRPSLGFEPNVGQAPGRVRFLSAGSGYSLLLGHSRLALLLGGGRDSRPDSAVAIRFAGARPDSIRPISRLPGDANFIEGSSRHSHTRIPTYAAIRYHSLWPGVDLSFHGDQRRLEYDFDLAPGASAGEIRLALPGARLRLGHGGELMVSAAGRSVAMLAPRSYQELDGSKFRIASRWVIGPGQRLGIAVGPHDPRLPLVIDPVLVDDAFFGGSVANVADGVAVGSDGSSYVAGWTTSPGGTEPGAFPTTSGAYLRTSSGGPPLESGMAFVSKINPAGTAFEYSTFIGQPTGFAFSFAHAIAVDGSGDAYITGDAGTGYPTTAGAFQTEYSGSNQDDGNAFVTELNPSGNGLVYSTYLGGGLNNSGKGIAVDHAGDAFVTGATTSGGAGGTAPFPTTSGAYQRAYGGGSSAGPSQFFTGDAFVTELNPSGSALLYSTLLGGSGDDPALGIALGSGGDAFVAGRTDSPGTSFPTTAGAPQTSNAGGSFDAYVSELSANGSELIHSTLLGGSGDDEADGIAVDGSEPYVTGFTDSAGGSAAGDFPTSAGAFQSTNAGGYDAFVTKLTSSGTLGYSTLLGGGAGDQAFGIAVDPHGDAHVTGCTSSSGTTPFPTTEGAFQTTFGGGSTSCSAGAFGGDAFLIELNPAGSEQLYSTYLGSSADDTASAIALDGGDNVYVTGFTAAPPGSGARAFPSTSGGLDVASPGAGAVFLGKLSLPDSVPLPTLHTLTITREGSGAGTVSSTDAQIDCGSTCSHAYGDGTAVTLSATPASGSTFAGWSGGGCSGTGACGLTLGSDETVTATFDANPPAPSGAFTLGKPKLNKKKGTAKLPVEVPGAGILNLAGKGVKPIKDAVVHGAVLLFVKPTGKTKRQLKKTGHAKVHITVTFTPNGGVPADKATVLRLIDKRGRGH